VLEGKELQVLHGRCCRKYARKRPSHDVRPCASGQASDHLYRHHGGQTTRHTALEEEVEADLRLLAVYLALFRVPWIDRRAQCRRLLLVCSVPQQVNEATIL
jgi:hypothetical protein